MSTQRRRMTDNLRAPALDFFVFSKASSAFKVEDPPPPNTTTHYLLLHVAPPQHVREGTSWVDLGGNCAPETPPPNLRQLRPAVSAGSKPTYINLKTIFPLLQMSCPCQSVQGGGKGRLGQQIKVQQNHNYKISARDRRDCKKTA